jgi:hypothetical protein
MAGDDQSAQRAPAERNQDTSRYLAYMSLHLRPDSSPIRDRAYLDTLRSLLIRGRGGEVALRREIKIQPQDASLVRYRLGPARIYLDDVQAIYETILKETHKRVQDSEDGKSIEIFIRAGSDASAESPDDLRDAKPEELRRVRIGTSRPPILVELGLDSADVSASDPEGKDLVAGIRNYVNRRRSGWAVFYCWGYRQFVIIVSILCFCSASSSWSAEQTKVLAP